MSASTRKRQLVKARYRYRYSDARKKMKGKRFVKVSRLNWDIEMLNDIYMKRGFMITEPADITLDGE